MCPTKYHSLGIYESSATFSFSCYCVFLPSVWYCIHNTIWTKRTLQILFFLIQCHSPIVSLQVHCIYCFPFLCKYVPVDIHLMTLSVNEYNRTYYKGIGLSYDLKHLIVSFLLDNSADPATSAIP